MILELEYEPNRDWIPIARNVLRLLQKDLRLGKYLKNVLSDGKVETYPGYTKEQVVEAVDEFLRKKELLPKGHYAAVREIESSDHRDS